MSPSSSKSATVGVEFILPPVERGNPLIHSPVFSNASNWFSEEPTNISRFISPSKSANMGEEKVNSMGLA